MNYIFYGPDAGDRLERIQNLRRKLEHTYGDELFVYRYYLSEDKVAKIISNLDNGTLFAAHTFVIINNAELLSRKDDIRAFRTLLSKRDDTTTLIFSSDSDKLNRDLLALVKPKQQEKFEELTDSQKRHWIIDYLRKQHIDMDDEALELFISLVSDDIHSMKQELDKLLLFVRSELPGGGTAGDESADGTAVLLTSEPVEQYIYHSREESVFTLFSAYAQQDFPKALEILNKLQGGGASQETSILSRMIYHIRQLATLGNVRDQRNLQSSDFRNARVFGPHNAALYRSALNRLSTGAIQSHVLICSECEMMLRRHKSAIHRHILQLWLYNLFFFPAGDDGDGGSGDRSRYGGSRESRRREDFGGSSGYSREAEQVFSADHRRFE